MIYSTDFAFAALTDDGNVITWGNGLWGGDSSSVRHLLKKNEIKTIYSSRTSFIAITGDKKIIIWGVLFDFLLICFLFSFLNAEC